MYRNSNDRGRIYMEHSRTGKCWWNYQRKILLRIRLDLASFVLNR